DAKLLRQVAQDALHLGTVVLGMDLASTDFDAARRGAQDASEDAHQRRLARAVWPQQPEHAALDLQVNALERAYASAVDFRQLPYRHIHRVLSSDSFRCLPVSAILSATTLASADTPTRRRARRCRGRPAARCSRSLARA